jgi:hypothetical protein
VAPQHRNITFDATGDGIIVVKLQQASRFTMLTTIAGQPLKFEEIIIGGKEYDLSPDNPRWTVKPSTNSSNPSSFRGPMPPTSARRRSRKGRRGT